MTDTTFFADDFFAPADDPGLELTLEVKGRQVPIRIKRHVTVEDRLAAELAAIEVENGKVVRVDEARASIALVARAIKSWPFVNRDGTPLPVTAENVSRFLGAVEPILMALNAADEESAKALDPSAPQSVEG